jgi:two-component system cell cycle sensor histidine kinase/response regulator CckA
VDDEDGVRWVTASVLRRLGYQVLEASTGSEGIRLAREQAGKLDLLFTDVTMGDVSGIEVASAFREANPDRPIIFTSGYGGQEMVRTAEREGGTFLDKPYDITRLARAVEDALVADSRRLDSVREARE